MPSHFHPDAHLVLVLDGALELDRRHQSQQVTRGTLSFLPPGEIHANRFYTGMRTFQIMATAPWLERLGQATIPLHIPVEFQRGLPVWLATRLYREFLHSDELSPLVMEGLMLELMVAMSRDAAAGAETSLPLWLREAQELLHAHFTDKLSLDTLAGTLGVHPAHLTRAFRQHYHMTIGDYVRGLRIEAACRLLTTSEIPIAQLALELGFADQGHFSRIFKSCMGSSPAAFRKLSERAVPR